MRLTSWSSVEDNIATTMKLVPLGTGWHPPSSVDAPLQPTRWLLYERP